MENTISAWRRIQQTGKYPADFSPALRQAWEAARREKVPFDMDCLAQYTQSTLKQLKQASMRLYAYTNRCISLVLTRDCGEDMAVALFNQDGILLKCYGSERALQNLENCGVRRLSDWRAASSGPNAVNLGLAANAATASCGMENYALPLADKAIFFSPCHLGQEDGRESCVLGGIAIITPLARAGRDYLMLANSIAYDIDLHFFMADTIEQFFANDERGVLNIDENVKTGKKYIMYCDRNLFRVLGIPAGNIYFRSLNEYIDPLPANEQFWSILDARKRVNDFLINLTIRGRTESFKITTEPYYQPKLFIKGIRIYFSSMKFLAAKISKKIGNNALCTFDDLIGQTSSFQVSLLQARSYAGSDKNILITGESGTGKKMFAQAIHNASGRADGPFIAVNCASLPKDQLIWQLFGYEDEKLHDVLNLGYLELANNGTLFLEEIGALPLEIQSILQAAIESRSFVRGGGYTAIPTDVRIICSSSCDLKGNVEERKFRRELYDQLNALALYLPPLRARRQDISLLADYFMKRACKKSNIEAKRLSPEARKLLLKFPWSGNVRELQNTVETVTMLSDAQFIECEDIFEYVNDLRLFNEIVWQKQSARSKVTPMELQRTLLSCDNNKKLTAQKLGISRRTLYRYLEKYSSQMGGEA